MVRITVIAIEQLASNFNSLLKYFRGYWETTKIFVLNIFKNKVIPNENFPEYGMYLWVKQPIKDNNL